MKDEITVVKNVSREKEYEKLDSVASKILSIYKRYVDTSSEINSLTGGEVSIVNYYGKHPTRVYSDNSDIVVNLSETPNNARNEIEEEFSFATTPPSSVSEGPEESYENSNNSHVDDDAEIVNGKTSFYPPFTKMQAKYHNPREADKKFPNRDDYCKNCVHYLEGGGCRFVRGNIEENAVCEDFYSDFGVFADEETMDNPNSGVHITAYMFGEIYDWDKNEIQEFLDYVKQRMEAER